MAIPLPVVEDRDEHWTVELYGVHPDTSNFAISLPTTTGWHRVTESVDADEIADLAHTMRLPPGYTLNVHPGLFLNGHLTHQLSVELSTPSTTEPFQLDPDGRPRTTFTHFRFWTAVTTATEAANLVRVMCQVIAAHEVDEWCQLDGITIANPHHPAYVDHDLEIMSVAEMEAFDLGTTP